MSENIEVIKEILNIRGNELDSFLEFCENTITNKILDRCHIESIPERLNTLIQEFLIEQYELNKDGVGKGRLEVSSASDNGQSVNFKVIGGISSMSKSADEFLDKKMKSLVAYRKMGR